MHLGVIDVSETASIRRFVRNLKAPLVYVIVHNAVVLLDYLTESADFTNSLLPLTSLYPWLLTTLLLPRLRNSGDARVVFVSSGGMYTQCALVERLKVTRYIPISKSSPTHRRNRYKSY